MSSHEQYCYVSSKTIDFAKSVGCNTPQFDEVVRTRNSGKPEDVIKHRGLEIYLKQKHGYNSPTYVQNSQILHGYDSSPIWKR